jgi:hypothetical protein
MPRPAAGGAVSLEWKLPPERYYQQTVCGRYSVCKLLVCGVTWYCAYLWPNKQLAATVLESEVGRTEAIRKMRAVCEQHAIDSAPLTARPSPPPEGEPDDVAEPTGP